MFSHRRLSLPSWILLSGAILLMTQVGPGSAGRRGANRTTTTEEEEENYGRKGRLFPIFQIVRFANDVCVGGSKNGTCYTAAECEDRGGVNSGSCASGYGVCCVFNLNCGDMSSENCTYFESNAVTAGACKATVCPCGDNICQLRLDFVNFMITGPATATSSLIGGTLAGQLIPGGAALVSTSSQCLTDTFQVVGSGGVTNSDVLCGTNTGEHLYVEADPNCNDLVFQLGANGIGTTLAGRQWSIKVSQFSCNYPNLAPPGCTQFFFGSNANSVRTFNYDGGAGRHLANQDQTICVRRERSNCRICWFAAANTDFAVSGTVTSMGASGMGFNMGTVCCSYGTAGTGVMGYDCAVIPGAETSGATAKMVGSNICGRSNGLITTAGNSIAVSAGDPSANSKTICSRRTPFYVRFRSDQFEFTAAEGVSLSGDRGFMLGYTMDAINCN